MQHSPMGPYERRRRRTTIALIESDWLDVKMWTLSWFLGFKLWWSRRSRCGGNENAWFGGSSAFGLLGGGGGRVVDDKEGGTGSCQKWDCPGGWVAGLAKTRSRGGETHQGWLGLGEWVLLCCAVLRRAGLLFGCGGDRRRVRVVARRNGEGKEAARLVVEVEREGGQRATETHKKRKRY